MKKNLLLLSACLLMVFAACKKPDGIANPKIKILGKWNVVSDSSHVGIGINNTAVNYAGQPGDYFDFRSNGIIYTREGDALDTLNYTLISDTKIAIPQFDAILNGEVQTSTIKNFNSHSLYIAAPRIITPGGVFGRSVKLSR